MNLLQSNPPPTPAWPSFRRCSFSVIRVGKSIINDDVRKLPDRGFVLWRRRADIETGGFSRAVVMGAESA
jgi:hypothetical protein